MLFENELVLVVSVYSNSRATTKKRKESITDIPRKERKWNHIKCSVEIAKGRKSGRQTTSRNMGNKLRTVSNKVDINPPISIIPLNVNSLHALIKRQRLPK